MSFTNKFRRSTVINLANNSWFLIRLYVAFLPTYILITYKIKTLFFQAALAADPQIVSGIIIESPTGTTTKVLSCILLGIFFYVALEWACEYTKKWQSEVEECWEEWDLVDFATGGITKVVCTTIQAGIWIISKICDWKEALAIGLTLICLVLTTLP